MRNILSQSLINELDELDQLTSSVLHGNLHYDGVLEQLNMTKREKILKQHPYAIYSTDNGTAWRTYLPATEEHGYRKPVRRKNKEDVESAVVKFYTELWKSQRDEVLTFEKGYETWLRYKNDNTSTKAKTIQEYINDWKRFFADSKLSKMPIRSITPVDIDDFYLAVTKDLQYTKKAVSNARGILNGIMNYYVKRGIIPQNPARDISLRDYKFKPRNNQNTNVYPEEDVQKLLRYLKYSVEDDAYTLAIQLSFYLYIRIGETKALKWSDVDWKEQTISLNRQITAHRPLNSDLSLGSHTEVEYEQMKGNCSSGYRTEPLLPEAIRILKKAQEINPDGTYIFEGKNGRCLTTDTFNRRLRKYCDEIGIQYYPSHKIRAYNASISYDGTNLAEIQRLMGHSSSATTFGYIRNVHHDKIKISPKLGLQGDEKLK